MSKIRKISHMIKGLSFSSWKSEMNKYLTMGMQNILKGAIFVVFFFFCHIYYAQGSLLVVSEEYNDLVIKPESTGSMANTLPSILLLRSHQASSSCGIIPTPTFHRL